jgi:hypothetical protein
VRFYWRARKTDEHLEGSIKALKDVIAGQATILAPFPFGDGYDDAAISGTAVRADDTGFPHDPKNAPLPTHFPAFAVVIIPSSRQ